MTELEYLLLKLVEEAGELIERAAKCSEFGMDEIQDGQKLTNKERLNTEVKDVNFISELIDRAVLNFPCHHDPVQWSQKYKKFLKYKELSKRLGRLEGK